MISPVASRPRNLVVVNLPTWTQLADKAGNTTVTAIIARFIVIFFAVVYFLKVRERICYKHYNLRAGRSFVKWVQSIFLNDGLDASSFIWVADQGRSRGQGQADRSQQSGWSLAPAQAGWSKDRNAAENERSTPK